MCARGQIAINVRGLEMLQLGMGETADDAWHRMKAKLGSGKLDETTLHKPQAVVSSGGRSTTGDTSQAAYTSVQPITDAAAVGDSDKPGLRVGNTGSIFAHSAPQGLTPHSALPTSNLNLLDQLEKWRIRPATPVANVTISIAQLTGSQLEQLLKRLPDGITYGLQLEKEADS